MKPRTIRRTIYRTDVLSDYIQTRAGADLARLGNELFDIFTAPDINKALDVIAGFGKRDATAIYHYVNRHNKPPAIHDDPAQRARVLRGVLKMFDKMVGGTIDKLQSGEPTSAAKPKKHASTHGKIVGTLSENTALRDRAIDATRYYIAHVCMEVFRAGVDRKDENAKQLSIFFSNTMSNFYAHCKKNKVDIKDDAELLKNFDEFYKTMEKKGHISPAERYALSESYRIRLHWPTEPTDINQAIEGLQKEYRERGRTKHVDDIKELIADLNKIGGDSRYIQEVKYTLMITKIEEAFLDEMEHFKKPVLGVGKPRSAEAFVKTVVSSERAYVYPKLLAKIIYDAYQKNPTLKASREGQEIFKAVCAIVEPKQEKRQAIQPDVPEPESTKKRLGM